MADEEKIIKPIESRYIRAIGLEVETALARTDFTLDYDEFRIKNDGSIYSNKGIAKEVTARFPDVKTAFRFLDDLDTYIVEEGINKSMGFHIHLSFVDMYIYTLLYSYEFVDLFRARLQMAFPEVEDRFRNTYCYAYYDRAYFYGRAGNRYKMINFYRAYSAHRTFEFRIFPSSTVDRLKNYLAFTVATVDYFVSEKEIRPLVREVVEEYEED